MRKFICFLALLTALSGCTAPERTIPVIPEPEETRMEEEVPGIPRFTRNAAALDYTGINFTPWDIEEAAARLPRQPKRAYTIMIYMNGSDLESEHGAATLDIIEMLRSGVDTSLVNVVLLTGGAQRWRNNVVPENECKLWRIHDGGLAPISGIGLRNMGDAGTLTSFINFSVQHFPAEKYGLIFWDHGGGSIAGYGHDEKFQGASLTLLEMNYAFERSDFAHTKAEFIGFDACLMGTVEMAVVAAPYAKYLIASEDLEPGDGWDYRFLGTLSQNPGIGGAELGRVIVDSFMAFYCYWPNDFLSLSVTDLSRVWEVKDAMEALMAQCTNSLLLDRYNSFHRFSQRRGNTKTFGEGSPRDNDCDMVDLGDLARNFSDLFPAESEALLSALRNIVVYNRHNSTTQLSGLSAYYVFGGKANAARSMRTYRALQMGGIYTAFLQSFADILTADGLYPEAVADGNILVIRTTLWKPSPESPGWYSLVGIQSTTDNDLWATVGGEFVAMYEIGESGGRMFYAIPAMHNGRDANIIVSNGEILGIRHNEGYVLQKGLDHIVNGDEISFYRKIRNFNDSESGSEAREEWVRGELITVSEPLTLDWQIPDGSYYASELIVDTQLHENYSPPVRFRSELAA